MPVRSSNKLSFSISYFFEKKPLSVRYIGKKAYVDEILKNNSSITKIVSEIYKQCFKESFRTFKDDLKSRLHKKYPLKQNLYQFLSVTTKFLIAFFTPFLPRKLIIFISQVKSTAQQVMKKLQLKD